MVQSQLRVTAIYTEKWVWVNNITWLHFKGLERWSFSHWSSWSGREGSAEVWRFHRSFLSSQGHCLRWDQGSFISMGKLVIVDQREIQSLDSIPGIGNFHDLEEVENNAIRICKTTHSDKTAVAASVLLATLVASMLQVSSGFNNFRFRRLDRWRFISVPMRSQKFITLKSPLSHLQGKSGTESLALLTSSASPYLHESPRQHARFQQLLQNGIEQVFPHYLLGEGYRIHEFSVALLFATGT